MRYRRAVEKAPAPRSPVRIWSQDGPDTETLHALVERCFSDLPRLTPVYGYLDLLDASAPARG